MTSTSSLSTQHSEPSTAIVPEEVIDFKYVDDPDFESDDDAFSEHSIQTTKKTSVMNYSLLDFLDLGQAPLCMLVSEFAVLPQNRFCGH